MEEEELEVVVGVAESCEEEEEREVGKVNWRVEREEEHKDYYFIKG